MWSTAYLQLKSRSKSSTTNRFLFPDTIRRIPFSIEIRTCQCQHTCVLGNPASLNFSQHNFLFANLMSISQMSLSKFSPVRFFFRASQNIPSITHARAIAKEFSRFGELVEYKFIRVCRDRPFVQYLVL